MKTYFTLIMTATALLAWPRLGTAQVAASDGGGYSTLRVCEDDAIVRGADGTDCGHISYVVFDPDSRQLVSVFLSGGVLADRLVAVPYESFRFGGSSDITLVNINQQTLVNAPAIQISQISRGTRIDPALLQRSYEHFGVKSSSLRVSSKTETRSEVNRSERQGEDSRRGDVDRNHAGRDGATARQGDVKQPDAARPGSRDETEKHGEQAPSERKRNEPNSQAEIKRPDAQRTEEKRADTPPSEPRHNDTAEKEQKRRDQPPAERKNTDAKEEGGSTRGAQHPADRREDAPASDRKRPEASTEPRRQDSTEHRAGENSVPNQPAVRNEREQKAETGEAERPKAKTKSQESQGQSSKRSSERETKPGDRRPE
jgi:hypothetical protein